MRVLRSERYAALLLLAAAALGLGLANSGLAGLLARMRDFPLNLPLLGVSLSAGDWVKDGLLAIFFFLAAVELRHELAHGELSDKQAAMIPALAAIGGVVVPAVVFLLIVNDGHLARGWPIPTATDVAFALGILALAGRALPGRVRAFLLALAVLDDLIAIVIIAAFFTAELNPLPLLLAVPVVLVFGWLSKVAELRDLAKASRTRVASVSLIAVLIVLGLLAWLLVYYSGVHPTIGGVALGLVMSGRAGRRARHALEPLSNAVVLPLFAFVAALVVIPAVGLSRFSPVFWAIVIALPIGKLVGISSGAAIASALVPRRMRIPFGDVLTIAGLGGIGFTVSLLMNELAYAGDHEIAVEGTLGVLVASVISALVGAAIAAVRGSQYRRRNKPGSAE